jgi:hypothetical protein
LRNPQNSLGGIHYIYFLKRRKKIKNKTKEKKKTKKKKKPKTKTQDNIFKYM